MVSVVFHVPIVYTFNNLYANVAVHHSLIFRFENRQSDESNNHSNLVPAVIDEEKLRASCNKPNTPNSEQTMIYSNVLFAGKRRTDHWAFCFFKTYVIIRTQ